MTKILIVEDEALVAIGIQAALEEHGYEVVAVADDEASAVRAAADHAPDLALVDMRLSGGDSGLDVAAGLYSLNVAVVFATGNCPGRELREDLAIGCLHKPLSDDQLLAGIAVARARKNGCPHPAPPPGMHLFG